MLFVMVDWNFNFSYDLLRAFYYICKNFHLQPLINKNDIFPFQKKNKKIIPLSFPYKNVN
jgi:hypothetical protein